MPIIHDRLDIKTFEEVVRLVPDFVIVMDLEGKVLYMNRVAAGFTLADVIGADSIAFIDLPYREMYASSFRRVVETGAPAEEYELTISPSPDQTRWYRANLSPILRDGRVRFVVSVGTDITELRGEREARSEAQEFVGALRELVPICSWCHRVRSDRGFWSSVEEFVESETGGHVTHGMCPECLVRETEGGGSDDGRPSGGNGAPAG
jgi:PAS domain S-box-containing protein